MISRREHKYFIHASGAESLVARLQSRLRPDPVTAGKRLPIVSLYFDTPELDFYNDKNEGEKFRQKFRIRWYPEPGQAVETAWLEIKRKHDNIINKIRHAVPADQALRLARGDRSVLDTVPDEFGFTFRRHDLRPVSIVSYHREAWMGIDRERVRITLDYLTRGAPPPRDDLLSARGETMLFDPARVILEIKTSTDFPSWLMREARRHEVSAQSISKYCASVTPLYPWHHCVKLISR